MSSKHHASALFLCTVLVGLLMPLQAGADDGRRDSFSASLGFTTIDPGVSSENIRVFPDGGGKIVLDDTIRDRGSATRPSLTLNWRLPLLDGNFSLETALAPAYHFSFEARGGQVDNAVAGKLGETDMLPPVLVLSYTFPVSPAAHPYLGLGGTYLYSFNSEITTSQLASAELEIENVATWLIQAGINIDLDWLDRGDKLFLNLDVKYIGPVEADAEIRNINVGGTSGDSKIRLELEPWAFGAGLGWRF